MPDDAHAIGDGAALPPESAPEDSAEWRALLAASARAPLDISDSPLHALYGPLSPARRNGWFAIARLALS